MKFGVREICDVVFRKKAAGWFGKLYLEKDMPVLYFDTLKTSSLEGQATTVYAQGGRGNPRLVAWEGDRTVTFTMEDALISAESFSILSGAGFMDASAEQPIYVHTTEQVALNPITNKFVLSKMPAAYGGVNQRAEMYVMVLDESGAIDTRFVPFKIAGPSAEEIANAGLTDISEGVAHIQGAAGTNNQGWEITMAQMVSAINSAIGKYNEAHTNVNGFVPNAYQFVDGTATEETTVGEGKTKVALTKDAVLFFDYYVKAESGVRQIDIEADKFGGSYYVEASTLFRDQATGDDYPAEFVIPNCKVQSNFTFTMAPTGDPSTFTFTMDAFPDYTKFDKTKKVIAALQIVEEKNSFGRVTGAESGGNNPGVGE